MKRLEPGRESNSRVKVLADLSDIIARILDLLVSTLNLPLFCPLKCFYRTGDIMTPESEALEWQQQTSGEFRQIRSQEIISFPFRRGHGF
jgi:hypothetical protein